jgi:glycosyltransferase involved in cell wall biosynthesis
MISEEDVRQYVPVSVAVCVKNRESLIEACLRSIVDNHPAEIIVIDGDSTDRTVEIARQYADQIYSDGGQGLGHARQMAAQKARQEYVAYVDSDVTLPPGVLSRMLHELQVHGYAGIHAQMVSPDVDGYWEWAQDQHFRLTFNREGTRSSIGTVTAIFERNILLQYGFDPFFTGASEDGDLCYRLRRAGHSLGVSSVAINHRHRVNLTSLVKQRLWYGRGHARFVWKHRAIGRLVLFLLFPIYGVAAAMVRGRFALIPYFLVEGAIRHFGMFLGLVELSLTSTGLAASIRPRRSNNLD